MWFSWNHDGTLDVDRLRLLGVPTGSVIRPPRLLITTLRGEAETPGTCSLLVRRDVVESVGGFEPSFRGMYEDQVFLAKVFLEYSVLVEGGSTGFYRQHSVSACHLAETRGEFHPVAPHPARRVYLEWLERYIAERRTADREVLRALDTALRAYRPRLRSRVRSFVAKGLRMSIAHARQSIQRLFRMAMSCSS